MAAVTICSDFGAKKLKAATVSTLPPSINHEVMGPDAVKEESEKAGLNLSIKKDWDRIICISRVDISPSSLDSSLWSIQPGISHDVFRTEVQ